MTCLDLREWNIHGTLQAERADEVTQTLTSPIVQLADYSEGSMGPDIHPYPEGSESALMVG